MSNPENPTLKFITFDDMSPPLQLKTIRLVHSEVLGDGKLRDHDINTHLTVSWNKTTYALMQDEALIGTGGLGEDSIDQGVAEIVNVAIMPARRGEGFGRLLIGHLEAQAMNRGANLVRLGALESAEGFYRRLGYRAIDGADPSKMAKWLLQEKSVGLTGNLAVG